MSEKIKVDITNLDPKYWDEILASEGMPGENCPNNKKTKEINEEKITSCKKCNPVTMSIKGCCTGSIGREIGQGSKIFRYNKTNYDICGALEQNDKKEFICSIHDSDELPYPCQSFECDISIRNIIRKK